MAAPQVFDPRDEIARRLDALREAKSLTLSELAVRAGVKIGVLSALHTGRRKGRNMKLGVAAQLCRALETTVGVLLGEEDLLPPLPAGMDLSQLSQTDKDTLIIQLAVEVLQRGLQLPPVVAPRRSDDADES
jgi:transcriptional regulator with XRE-family HTH domain